MKASAMMNARKFPLVLLLVSLFIGCRARPAPDSGFLQDSKLMTADKSVPFNRMYRNPKFNEKRFTEIYIAPVNTDYVMAQNIWEKAALANVNKDDVEKN